MFLPEKLPSPRIKFPKGKEGNVKPYGGGVTPLRWLKSGELELSSEDMMLSRDNGKSYTGVLHFTISFDAQHKGVREDRWENKDGGPNECKPMSETPSGRRIETALRLIRSPMPRRIYAFLIPDRGGLQL